MFFQGFDPFDLNNDGTVDGIDYMIFNEIINKPEDDDTDDNENGENDGYYAAYGK